MVFISYRAFIPVFIPFIPPPPYSLLFQIYKSRFYEEKEKGIGQMNRLSASCFVGVNGMLNFLRKRTQKPADKKIATFGASLIKCDADEQHGNQLLQGEVSERLDLLETVALAALQKVYYNLANCIIIKNVLGRCRVEKK